MRQATIRAQFVEYIPETLDDGVLYVSARFKTAVHRCCCGCHEEVVTPLSPAEWRVIRTGDAVSLYPSIGNWGLACQSHYWITRNRIEWAKPMTDAQIERVRRRDRIDKEIHITRVNAVKGDVRHPEPTVSTPGRKSFLGHFLVTVRRWFR